MHEKEANTGGNVSAKILHIIKQTVQNVASKTKIHQPSAATKNSVLSKSSIRISILCSQIMMDTVKIIIA